MRNFKNIPETTLPLTVFTVSVIAFVGVGIFLL